MSELIWDGKYKDGKKTAPVRVALPFQTIETVNESRQLGKQGMADMFAVQANQQAKASGWYNRLIWGDKKYVLPSLLPEFAGKVNLIYIDPPFDTGANFSFTANIPGYSPPLGEPEGADTPSPPGRAGVELGIDLLGWEFAFELHEAAEQFAAANKVNLKFKKIPREVLEKKAVEQGDIRFFELAYLDVSSKVSNRSKGEVTLRLENFVVPPGEVPEDVQRSITHWSQWIDYWAVDWNYLDDTFHNEWQSYRTKQDPKLNLEAKHTYEETGKFQVVVKVIDILGNDTTKLLTVEI